MRLALAFAVGVAWAETGVPWGLLPLVAALFLFLPIPAWSGRSSNRAWLSLAAGAGLLMASAGPAGSTCGSPSAGDRVELRGRFLATPRAGSAPFVVSSGCGVVTVVLDATDVPAGRSVDIGGVWRQGSRGFWFLASSWRAGPDTGDTSPRWRVVRWRDSLVDRIEGLYGARAPMVAALTLARREGFDPQLRDTFARTGLAHLLAISGFHVGVIAGLFLAALRLAGARPQSARLGAALGAWCYVALIGFPDAACRAALILAFLSASTARGRPPARWGALASAWLVLLVLDPTRLASPGFQLSFAGAGGLVAWAAPLRSTLRRIGRGRIPDSLIGGVASGVAATLATTPVVAWHFEQVSLVGVPATLVASPMVAIALPGAIMTVALDFVSHGAASFLAGGVALLLHALERGALWLGDLPWVAVWTSPTSVVAMLAGIGLASFLASRPWIGGLSRRVLTLIYVCVFLLAWPVLLSVQGRGTVEVVMIDVGQGDATAIRGPDGRWILIDAGPPVRTGDPRGHPVLRALRARGVRRLEALVLTHADLDHIGGAGPLLGLVRVGAVYDPALPAGKEDFVDVLAIARARGVPWLAARPGVRIDLGELTIEVLAPSDSILAAGAETNEASVVLRLRYGDFDALLTGDAYKAQERALVPMLEPGIEVLKVGHHGSDTSTDPSLLDQIRPELALISAGRGNRYGHPTPTVLADLGARGIRVRRTDRDGTVTVLGRADGRFSVRHGGR
ncbi:MAG: DNA internalization-related competence protein ComEC/Rec2 [Gemmatimonadota bacterium]